MLLVSHLPLLLLFLDGFLSLELKGFVETWNLEISMENEQGNMDWYSGTRFWPLVLAIKSNPFIFPASIMRNIHH